MALKNGARHSELNTEEDYAYARQLLAWSKALGGGERVKFAEFASKNPLTSFLTSSPSSAEFLRS